MARDQHRIEIRATEPDPLYDAPYLIFAYTAWTIAVRFAGDTAGLAVLVAATVALTAWALRLDRRVAPRSFAADFATIILFCGAAIGAGVFLLRALAAEPVIVLLATLAAIAGVTVARVAQRTR